MTPILTVNPNFVRIWELSFKLSPGLRNVFSFPLVSFKKSLKMDFTSQGVFGCSTISILRYHEDHAVAMHLAHGLLDTTNQWSLWTHFTRRPHRLRTSNWDSIFHFCPGSIQILHLHNYPAPFPCQELHREWVSSSTLYTGMSKLILDVFRPHFIPYRKQTYNKPFCILSCRFPLFLLFQHHGKNWN